MRENLFRGKRVDGEWEYGYYVRFGATGSRRAYLLPHYASALYVVDVIPETVGQYTGLTDKNGKKIFEGDLVSTDIARPYNIVEFRDGCFMFNCNDGGDDYYDIMLPITKETHTVYEYGEVIGNIHDNPEMLKDGDT